ncbi:hypothetical protein HYPSUDRAFT_201598 [Hypholoma sublateritium FD-334 SS-4]|uniref:Fungal-type protein kinase domain-containing protein n=1 Tax=Hypholoma sublateritium (strain FD-334 SS-4) TaxID=945553 RepID=A0A0D2NWZ2_HYPSF|nr:hypothetical protein HYPSUDRAFT_201598 [Hypholoma sublateritium FD-334 SS-4]
MAYLPHIDDPSVFCDSSVFSDINSVFSSTVLSSYMPTNEGNSARVEKKTTSATAFPILPPAHNYSALGNPERFQAYITTQLPSAQAGSVGGLPPPLPEIPSEKCSNKINSTFFRDLLKDSFKQSTTELVWIEKLVFCDEVLPVKFEEKQVTADTNICKVPSSSILHQPDATTEPSVQNWLNNIANNLAAVHKFSDPSLNISRSDRTFDCRAATRAAEGSCLNLKPDICVIRRVDPRVSPKTPEERLHWRNVYAFIEVTSSDTSRLANILKQIQQKSMCLFDVQPQRRFVCALGLFGNPPNIVFTFVVVDRSGLLFTKPIPLRSYGASFFLRIIFAFAFAKPEVLGWDPTMKLNPETNEVVSIDVTGFYKDSTVATTHTFEIVKLLHSSPILYSRGTRVWIVKDEQGQFCVLKDSWILSGRTTSEVQFTRNIDRAIQEDPDGYLFKHSCPSYVIGQEEVWSTDTIRGVLAKSPTRIQRRIVTGPIGDPITSFRSKKEFVSVLLDIVNSLEFLYKAVGVIHGDISMNNILINRVWKHEPNNSPSRLRIIACSNARNRAYVNILNNSAPQASTVQVSATSTTVIQAPTNYTTVVQASATSTAQALTSFNHGRSDTGASLGALAATTSITLLQATSAADQASGTVASVPMLQVSTTSAHFDSPPTATSVALVEVPATPVAVVEVPATSVAVVEVPATSEVPATTESTLMLQASATSADISPALAVQADVRPSVDYMGTAEHIEYAGMLIDCDFMRHAGQETNLTSGTLPFMAIEALISTSSANYQHHPGHDLESLLYTILTICHYTTGAGGQLRESKTESKAIEFNKWFTTAVRKDLANTKTITLLSFETYIKTGLAPYWDDFAQFLKQLVNVTWDSTARTLLETPNIATHAAYRNVLLKALAFYEKEEKELPALYAVVPRGKRSRAYQYALPQSKRPRLGHTEVSSSEMILPRPRVSKNLADYCPSIETPLLD